MARGGKRKGAGRPKKSETLEKEALRAVLRQKVAKRWGPLIDAQISNACGISYLVVRDKQTGKFVRVAQGQAEKVDPSQEIIEIWEKDPSVQAFTDLANRAIDKPAEQMKVTGAEDGPVEVLFRWLS